MAMVQHQHPLEIALLVMRPVLRPAGVVCCCVNSVVLLNTMCFVHYAVFSVHYAVISVHYAVFSAHYAVGCKTLWWCIMQHAMRCITECGAIWWCIVQYSVWLMQ